LARDDAGTESAQRGGKMTAAAAAPTDPATSLQHRATDLEGGHAQAQTHSGSAHRHFRTTAPRRQHDAGAGAG